MPGVLRQKICKYNLVQGEILIQLIRWWEHLISNKRKTFLAKNTKHSSSSSKWYSVINSLYKRQVHACILLLKCIALALHGFENETW